MRQLVAGVPVRPYKYPQNKRQYYADPVEPIDRWYQATFSSNAGTIKRIVLDIFGGAPDCLIDPFSGAGSTAVAARGLSVPFVGVELDPVLVEITALKSSLAEADLWDLDKYAPKVISPEQLSIRNLSRASSFVLGFCLAALLSMRSRRDMFALVQEDLTGSAGPVSGSSVRCGDSRCTRAWGQANTWRKAAVFTSPPFPPAARVQAAAGSAAPHEWMDRIRGELESMLADSTGCDCESGQSSPEEVVVSALSAALKANGPYTGIVEFQDNSVDLQSLGTLVRLLGDAQGITVHEILSTQDFSGFGTLFELVVEAKQVVR